MGSKNTWVVRESEVAENGDGTESSEFSHQWYVEETNEANIDPRAAVVHHYWWPPTSESVNRSVGEQGRASSGHNCIPCGE